MQSSTSTSKTLFQNRYAHVEVSPFVISYFHRAPWNNDHSITTFPIKSINALNLKMYVFPRLLMWFAVFFSFFFSLFIGRVFASTFQRLADANYLEAGTVALILIAAGAASAFLFNDWKRYIFSITGFTFGIPLATEFAVKGYSNQYEFPNFLYSIIQFGTTARYSAGYLVGFSAVACATYFFLRNKKWTYEVGYLRVANASSSFYVFSTHDQVRELSKLRVDLIEACGWETMATVSEITSRAA